MSRRTKFRQKGFYHLYNRGNRKENIFLLEADYLRFLKYLKKYTAKCDIRVIAYCLMPNHFHLFVRQNAEKTISNFMQRLCTAYAMYFNVRHRKVGHVFQSPFGASEISTWSSFRRVEKYIKNNPVKDGLVERYYDYRWLWIGPDLALYRSCFSG